MPKPDKRRSKAAVQPQVGAEHCIDPTLINIPALLAGIAIHSKSDSARVTALRALSGMGYGGKPNGKVANPLHDRSLKILAHNRNGNGHDEHDSEA